VTLRSTLRRTPKSHATRPFCAFSPTLPILSHPHVPLLSIFRTFFQVPYPASPLFATLTKSAGVYTNNSHSGTHPPASPILYPLFVQVLTGAHFATPFLSYSSRNGGYGGCSHRSTFKPSNDTLVPLRHAHFGATIRKGTEFLCDPGKQLRSPRCLRILERTTGTVRSWSPSQVVPGSSVLKF
jgi:hypothetical protein